MAMRQSTPSRKGFEQCMVCLCHRRCAHVRPHAFKGASGFGRQACGPSAICVPCCEQMISKFHGGASFGAGQFVCPVCKEKLGPMRRALQEGREALRWSVTPDTPRQQQRPIKEHPTQRAMREGNVPELRRLWQKLSAAEAAGRRSSIGDGATPILASCPRKSTKHRERERRGIVAAAPQPEASLEASVDKCEGDTVTSEILECCAHPQGPSEAMVHPSEAVGHQPLALEANKSPPRKKKRKRALQPSVDAPKASSHDAGSVLLESSRPRDEHFEPGQADVTGVFLAQRHHGAISASELVKTWPDDATPAKLQQTAPVRECALVPPVAAPQPPLAEAPREVPRKKKRRVQSAPPPAEVPGAVPRDAVQCRAVALNPPVARQCDEASSVHTAVHPHPSADIKKADGAGSLPEALLRSQLIYQKLYGSVPKRIQKVIVQDQQSQRAKTSETLVPRISSGSSDAQKSSGTQRKQTVIHQPEEGASACKPVKAQAALPRIAHPGNAALPHQTDELSESGAHSATQPVMDIDAAQTGQRDSPHPDKSADEADPVRRAQHPQMQQASATANVFQRLNVTVALEEEETVRMSRGELGTPENEEAEEEAPRNDREAMEQKTKEEAERRMREDVAEKMREESERNTRGQAEQEERRHIAEMKAGDDAELKAKRQADQTARADAKMANAEALRRFKQGQEIRPIQERQHKQQTQRQCERRLPAAPVGNKNSTSLGSLSELYASTVGVQPAAWAPFEPKKRRGRPRNPSAHSSAESAVEAEGNVGGSEERECSDPSLLAVDDTCDLAIGTATAIIQDEQKERQVMRHQREQEEKRRLEMHEEQEEKQRFKDRQETEVKQKLRAQEEQEESHLVKVRREQKEGQRQETHEEEEKKGRVTQQEEERVTSQQEEALKAIGRSAETNPLPACEAEAVETPTSVGETIEEEAGCHHLGGFDEIHLMAADKVLVLEDVEKNDRIVQDDNCMVENLDSGCSGQAPQQGCSAIEQARTPSEVWEPAYTADMQTRGVVRCSGEVPPRCPIASEIAKADKERGKSMGCSGGMRRDGLEAPLAELKEAAGDAEQSRRHSGEGAGSRRRDACSKQEVSLEHVLQPQATSLQSSLAYEGRRTDDVAGVASIAQCLQQLRLATPDSFAACCADLKALLKDPPSQSGDREAERIRREADAAMRRAEARLRLLDAKRREAELRQERERAAAAVVRDATVRLKHATDEDTHDAAAAELLQVLSEQLEDAGEEANEVRMEAEEALLLGRGRDWNVATQSLDLIEQCQDSAAVAGDLETHGEDAQVERHSSVKHASDIEMQDVGLMASVQGEQFENQQQDLWRDHQQGGQSPKIEVRTAAKFAVPFAEGGLEENLWTADATTYAAQHDSTAEAVRLPQGEALSPEARNVSRPQFTGRFSIASTWQQPAASLDPGLGSDHDIGRRVKGSLPVDGPVASNLSEPLLGESRRSSGGADVVSTMVHSPRIHDPQSKVVSSDACAAATVILEDGCVLELSRPSGLDEDIWKKVTSCLAADRSYTSDLRRFSKDPFAMASWLQSFARAFTSERCQGLQRTSEEAKVVCLANAVAVKRSGTQLVQCTVRQAGSWDRASQIASELCRMANLGEPIKAILSRKRSLMKSRLSSGSSQAQTGKRRSSNRLPSACSPAKSVARRHSHRVSDAGSPTATSITLRVSDSMHALQVPSTQPVLNSEVQSGIDGIVPESVLPQAERDTFVEDVIRCEDARCQRSPSCGEERNAQIEDKPSVVPRGVCLQDYTVDCDGIGICPQCDKVLAAAGSMENRSKGQAIGLAPDAEAHCIFEPDAKLQMPMAAVSQHNGIIGPLSKKPRRHRRQEQSKENECPNVQIRGPSKVERGEKPNNLKELAGEHPSEAIHNGLHAHGDVELNLAGAPPALHTPGKESLVDRIALRMRAVGQTRLAEDLQQPRQRASPHSRPFGGAMRRAAKAAGDPKSKDTDGPHRQPCGEVSEAHGHVFNTSFRAAASCLADGHTEPEEAPSERDGFFQSAAWSSSCVVDLADKDSRKPTACVQDAHSCRGQFPGISRAHDQDPELPHGQWQTGMIGAGCVAGTGQLQRAQQSPQRMAHMAETKPRQGPSPIHSIISEAPPQPCISSRNNPPSPMPGCELPRRVPEVVSANKCSDDRRTEIACVKKCSGNMRSSPCLDNFGEVASNSRMLGESVSTPDQGADWPGRIACSQSARRVSLHAPAAAELPAPFFVSCGSLGSSREEIQSGMLRLSHSLCSSRKEVSELADVAAGFSSKDVKTGNMSLDECSEIGVRRGLKRCHVDSPLDKRFKTPARKAATHRDAAASTTSKYSDADLKRFLTEVLGKKSTGDSRSHAGIESQGDSGDVLQSAGQCAARGVLQKAKWMTSQVSPQDASQGTFEDGRASPSEALLRSRWQQLEGAHRVPAEEDPRHGGGLWSLVAKEEPVEVEPPPHRTAGLLEVGARSVSPRPRHLPEDRGKFFSPKARRSPLASPKLFRARRSSLLRRPASRPMHIR